MELRFEDLAPIVFDGSGVKFTPLYSLARVYINGERYYFERGVKDTKIIPSVSAFLNKHIPMPSHLQKWIMEKGEEGIEYRDRRAAYGTAMHVCIERMVKAGYVITSKEVRDIAHEFLPDITHLELMELQKDVCSFAVFAAKHDLVPVALEVPLYSARYGFAGTADIPCQITLKNSRVNALIDMKSGRKGFFERHAFQLFMYRDAWNEHYGDIFPIKRIFNWAPTEWKKEPDYKLKEWSEDENNIYARLLLYYELEKLLPEHRDKMLFIFQGIHHGVPQYEHKSIIQVINEKYQ